MTCKVLHWQVKSYIDRWSHQCYCYCILAGLAFDEWDLDYYTKLFKEKIKRNPTNVECFDLAQSNRYIILHWNFYADNFLELLIKPSSKLRKFKSIYTVLAILSFNVLSYYAIYIWWKKGHLSPFDLFIHCFHFYSVFIVDRK